MKKDMNILHIKLGSAQKRRRAVIGSVGELTIMVSGRGANPQRERNKEVEGCGWTVQIWGVWGFTHRRPLILKQSVKGKWLHNLTHQPARKSLRFSKEQRRAQETRDHFNTWLRFPGFKKSISQINCQG